jgi:hypothetical protein
LEKTVNKYYENCFNGSTGLIGSDLVKLLHIAIGAEWQPSAKEVSILNILN